MSTFSSPRLSSALSKDGYVVEFCGEHFLLYRDNTKERAVVLSIEDVHPPFCPPHKSYTKIWLSRATRWSVPEAEAITDAEREQVNERLVAALHFLEFTRFHIV